MIAKYNEGLTQQYRVGWGGGNVAGSEKGFDKKKGNRGQAC